MEKDSLFNDLLERMHIVEEPWKDVIKYWVLNRVYYYGDHNSFNPEGRNSMLPNIHFKNMLLNVLILLISQVRKSNLSNLVQNCAYFKMNQELNEIGYNTTAAPWNLKYTDLYTGDIDIYRKCKKILKIERENFNDAILGGFVEKIKVFASDLKTYYSRCNIKATFHANDLHIMDNITIKVFSQLNRPSFVALHGIPARYNDIDENRGSYLLVWGEKLKQNYINAGINPDKIIITGHPQYSGLPFPKKLRFDTTNILVLTMDIPAIPHSSYYFHPGDRSDSLYYIFSVQHVLKQLGVKHARLRCHPGENPKWYLKYIDKTFYTLDSEELKNSIQSSTLVIGPSSTVAIESLVSGVNYIVYEPRNYDGNCLTGLSSVPPFDASEPKMNSCHDENRLKHVIQQRQCVDMSILEEYIQDHFDLSEIKRIIG